MSDPTQGGGGPTSVSFEELEQQQAAAQTQTPDLAQIKLEGDNVPQLLRGKTVAEAIQQFGSLEEAVRLSEQARKQAELTAQTALQGGRQPEPVRVEEPQELTDEQLKQLYEEDPIKAITAMNDRAIRRAEKNLEVRLGPLFNGTSAQVEQAARTKYADEFALFGDEITKVASQIPNAKAVLANPAAWDDLVALVRGRPGNFDRLLEHKTSKTTTVARETAQQQQVETMGFSDNAGSRRSIPTSVAQLDPIQKEIAEKMGLSAEDYIKWSKV